MKLVIKNMVSLRCILLVKAELNRLEIPFDDVRLGEVELSESIPATKFQQLQLSLMQAGLEIINDRKTILVEKVKTLVVEMIHHKEELPRENYSRYISQKLNQNYTYLANIFSESQGITIEHFIIGHKIEKVKELMLYNELSLTEISYRLNYSSVAHLSTQFKKVTGMTPTAYKQMQHKLRNSLENISSNVADHL
jgi:AraC-like DNA-binding protein